MQNQAQQIEALRAALPSFTMARDIDFATSLLNQYGRKGDLSPKQWPYVTSLVAKVTQGEKPRETEALGDLTGINALFGNASASGLKKPAIVLSVEGVGPVRISVASERARVPGSLDVVAEESNTWFGRILQDGNFQKSPRAVSPAALLSRLHDFAENPLKIAAEHGKMTGHCCFCNKKLTNPASVELGYGPVCAKKWAGAQ